MGFNVCVYMRVCVCNHHGHLERAHPVPSGSDLPPASQLPCCRQPDKSTPGFLAFTVPLGCPCSSVAIRTPTAGGCCHLLCSFRPLCWRGWWVAPSASCPAPPFCESLEHVCVDQEHSAGRQSQHPVPQGGSSPASTR